MSALPLASAVLCLNDDTVFEIGSACPTCGTEQWLSLARILSESRRGAITGARPSRTLPTLTGNPAAIRRLADGALAAVAALSLDGSPTYADLLLAAHNFHESVIESVVSQLAPADPELAALLRRSVLSTFVACLTERIDHGQH